MRAQKDLITRLTIGVLALAGLWAARSQNPQTPQALTLEKVTDNLYVIIGSGGNVAFMPTSEGVILVDDKFAQDGPQILAKVKSVTDKPVRYVLNTHQHGDHTGGNEALLAANAEIVIHKNARANMVAGKMPGIPHITFSDESQVFLGGKEVVARYLGRGHTNGDAVIYFPSERVLHTGDLFTNGAPYCDTSAYCSIKEWDQTLEKALQYDFDSVIPGHGPVMKKPDLVKYAKAIPVIRERLKKACAGGAADAVSRVDLADMGMTISPAFTRGVPGMCQELSQ
ncbi:MAG: MBL fold metallo-hydrolase [Acidobacteriia bacterium]|nr:MBL fold metallo-hydrolase [Terriglobia bacterium]